MWLLPLKPPISSNGISIYIYVYAYIYIGIFQYKCVLKYIRYINSIYGPYAHIYH